MRACVREKKKKNVTTCGDEWHACIGICGVETVVWCASPGVGAVDDVIYIILVFYMPGLFGYIYIVHTENFALSPPLPGAGQRKGSWTHSVEAVGLCIAYTPQIISRVSMRKQ